MVERHRAGEADDGVLADGVGEPIAQADEAGDGGDVR